jgi:hypothetical protein
VRAEQHKQVVAYRVEREVEDLFIIEQTVLFYEFYRSNPTAGHEPRPAVE